MGRFARAGRITALCALLPLAACTSLGGASPGHTSSADLTALDLASAVFAVDMPATVEPGAGPRVTYGTALDVALVPLDAEAVMAVLPAPPEGRSYAVYAFAPADQPKVRAAQQSPAGATLVVAPRVCVTPDSRKASDIVSILAIVPGQNPVTLTGPETLLALETRTGMQLPICQGHSG